MNLGVCSLIVEGFRRTKGDLHFLVILALPMAGLEIAAQYLPGSSMGVGALSVFGLIALSLWVDSAMNWAVHESLQARGGKSILAAYVHVLKKAPELALIWLNVGIGLILRLVLLVVPGVVYWTKVYLAPLIVLLSQEPNAHLAVSESTARLAVHRWMVFRWLMLWLVVSFLPEFLGSGSAFLALTVVLTVAQVIAGAYFAVLVYLKTQGTQVPVENPPPNPV